MTTRTVLLRTIDGGAGGAEARDAEGGGAGRRPGGERCPHLHEEDLRLRRLPDPHGAAEAGAGGPQGHGGAQPGGGLAAVEPERRRHAGRQLRGAGDRHRRGALGHLHRRLAERHDARERDHRLCLDRARRVGAAGVRRVRRGEHAPARLAAARAREDVVDLEVDLRQLEAEARAAGRPGRHVRRRQAGLDRRGGERARCWRPRRARRRRRAARASGRPPAGSGPRTRCASASRCTAVAAAASGVGCRPARRCTCRSRPAPGRCRSAAAARRRGRRPCPGR